MDAVGRLAGGIAHEFRNALCVILLQVDLAKGELSPTTPAYMHLDAIHKAARHASTITENLLAFSRKRAFNPEPFILDNFIDELAPIVRPLAGDHIRVDMDCGSNGAKVLFDPMQLEQVLINLVCNALDAMTGSGTLTISTRERPPEGGRAKSIVLSVRDTGTGISPAELPHIFEPFYTTKEVGKGTGLGLAISYGIVTQGGGSFEVHSTPGKGTNFDVFLPLYPRDRTVMPRPREVSSINKGRLHREARPLPEARANVSARRSSHSLAYGLKFWARDFAKDGVAQTDILLLAKSRAVAVLSEVRSPLAQPGQLSPGSAIEIGACRSVRFWQHCNGSETLTRSCSVIFL